MSTKQPHPPRGRRVNDFTLPDAYRRQSLSEGRMGGARMFGFTPPRSRLLMAACTKETAARLVEVGVHPAGSIWIPSPTDGRPEIGRLFAPDPGWRRPAPLGPDDGDRQEGGDAS